MSRTSNRPIPAKIIEPKLLLFLVKNYHPNFYKFDLTNPWACSLTLLTLVIYLIIYTPLKKKSAYATEAGAISGALPPLIGWVAAAGEPSVYGWILFGIYSLGNFYHFMAIAWNFRKDYRTGGFKLLNGNPDGFPFS